MKRMLVVFALLVIGAATVVAQNRSDQTPPVPNAPAKVPAPDTPRSQQPAASSPASFDDIKRGLGWPTTVAIPPQLPPNYEQVQAALGWYNLPAYRYSYQGYAGYGGWGNPYGLGYGYGYMGPQTFEAFDEETAKKIRDKRHSAIVKYDGHSSWLEGIRLEFWDGTKWVVPARPAGASHRYQKPYIVTIDDSGEVTARYTDSRGVAVVRTEQLVPMAQALSNGKRDYINKIPLDPSIFPSR